RKRIQLPEDDRRTAPSRWRISQDAAEFGAAADEHHGIAPVGCPVGHRAMRGISADAAERVGKHGADLRENAEARARDYRGHRRPTAYRRAWQTSSMRSSVMARPVGSCRTRSHTLSVTGSDTWGPSLRYGSMRCTPGKKYRRVSIPRARRNA